MSLLTKSIDYQAAQEASPDVFSIFGIHINNVTLNEAVDSVFLDSGLCPHSSKKPQVGFFVNTHSFNIAASNRHFEKTLTQANHIFADGSGVNIAAKRAGFSLKENVNGTDLLPLLCEYLVKTQKSMYLLGAEPGTAEQASKNLKKRFPSLNIAGYQHGYFDHQKSEAVIDEINRSGCSLLLVAFGSPLQESWLINNKESLTVPYSLAVGGLFDFYSDKISRAPLFLRKMGCEWIWRLLQEPSRMWRRYILGNPLFLFRIFFKGKELRK